MDLMDYFFIKKMDFFDFVEYLFILIVQNINNYHFINSVILDYFHILDYFTYCNLKIVIIRIMSYCHLIDHQFILGLIPLIISLIINLIHIMIIIAFNIIINHIDH
jgi:hypothetical protein